MKRKLKITYGQLEATQERVSVFRNALENMDSAIEMFQNILSEQQSDAITALLEDGRDLRDEMEFLHGNLQKLENMLSGYIQDMTALVMPKSWDSMMLVDRNDIWVNMKQIKSNVSDTEQVIWGGALQHYKDVHTHIPKPHISSSMTESEKRSARAEYDRKVRERAQREENYKKLKAFTETQAKQAKQELEECYKEIEDLYRNRIVVYENTDDEYKKTAMDLYQQCTDFGEKLSNFGVKSAKTVWNVGRGALAAVLDLVKTALAIQDLKNTLDTLPLAVVTEVMGIEVPGLSLAKVDDLKNMAYGAVAVLQNPARVLAAFGQKIGDTVEEEGIAYSISYVAADVAIQVLLSKGLGEVKNVSKADDLVDVARTVDTLNDTVKIADELTDAAKVLDQVGDIKDAAMAVNVMDEANAVVKAVDEVNDVADAVKTVEKLDGVIESGINSYADFSKAVSNIGTRSDLTDAQKIKELQKLFENSNYKADINVPSDIQYVKGFDMKGNVIYDWPPKLGFDESTIKPITRTDGLSDTWDRYGYMGGSNFADVPSTGKYTYSERAIPYVENEAAYHTGNFNNVTYFDKIDAIKNGDIDTFNALLHNEGISRWGLDDFEELCDSYDSFISKANKELGDSVDATYGIKGQAAEWGDMTGGAGQIVTPFGGDVLEKIGILKEN